MIISLFSILGTLLVVPVTVYMYSTYAGFYEILAGHLIKETVPVPVTVEEAKEVYAGLIAQEEQEEPEKVMEAEEAAETEETKISEDTEETDVAEEKEESIETEVTGEPEEDTNEEPKNE